MKFIVTIISLFSLLVSNSLFAQNNANYIGHYHDISGIDLEGFYGPNYIPEKHFNKSHIVGDNYTNGRYYDLTDSIHEGYIRYNQRNSNFKFIKDRKNTYNSKTIRARECKSYVIGVDSFIRVINFNIERDLGAFQFYKPDFAEVLEEINSFTFLKHLHMNNNRILTTYIVKDGKGSLESLPKGGLKLKKLSLKYFGEVPLLNEYITANRIYKSDIENFVTIAYYYEKHKNNAQIYFDINWNKLKNSQNANYFAKVESIDKQRIKTSYYHKDSTLIYSGEYSSLSPKIKHGEFIWYYPNGSTWKTEEYSLNQYIDSVKTYYEDGKLYSIKTEHPYYYGELTYNQIFDRNSKGLLDEEGNGTEEFYDEVLDRSLFKEYKYGELESSYYLKYDVKIYTKCSKPTRIRSFDFKGDIFDNFSDYPEDALNNNIEWNCLVKFIVNPKGEFISYEIISTTNPTFDMYIYAYLHSTPISSIFSKPKHKKNKIFQEVVLPITFTIDGYSRTRNNNWLMYYPMNFNSLQMPSLPPPTYHF